MTKVSAELSVDFLGKNAAPKYLHNHILEEQIQINSRVQMKVEEQ